MVEFSRTNTRLKFVAGNAIPDMHGRAPHAATGGSSVSPAPFDARLLGERVKTLNQPLHETTLWGMGVGGGAELMKFLNATRSLAALNYVAPLVHGYWRDLIFHGRGMRLVNGNALVGALAHAAFEKGVDLRLRHAVRELLVGCIAWQHRRRLAHGRSRGRRGCA